MYVVIQDFYAKDTGYYLEVWLVTDDFSKAKLEFDEIVKTCREIDQVNGWTVQDDTEDYYFSYHEQPEYCRIQITMGPTI